MDNFSEYKDNKKERVTSLLISIQITSSLIHSRFPRASFN